MYLIDHSYIIRHTIEACGQASDKSEFHHIVNFQQNIKLKKLSVHTPGKISRGMRTAWRSVQGIKLTNTINKFDILDTMSALHLFFPFQKHLKYDFSAAVEGGVSKKFLQQEIENDEMPLDHITLHSGFLLN